jgi:hypothetical protein
MQRCVARVFTGGDIKYAAAGNRAVGTAEFAGLLAKVHKSLLLRININCAYINLLK